MLHPGHFPVQLRAPRVTLWHTPKLGASPGTRSHPMGTQQEEGIGSWWEN